MHPDLLDKGQIGRRWVLRHRLPDGSATDLIGWLTAVDGYAVTVETAPGEVQLIARDTLVAARRAPAAAGGRNPARMSADERHELLALLGFAADIDVSLTRLVDLLGDQLPDPRVLLSASGAGTNATVVSGSAVIASARGALHGDWLAVSDRYTAPDADFWSVPLLVRLGHWAARRGARYAAVPAHPGGP